VGEAQGRASDVVEGGGGADGEPAEGAEFGFGDGAGEPAVAVAGEAQGGEFPEPDGVFAVGEGGAVDVVDAVVPEEGMHGDSAVEGTTGGQWFGIGGTGKLTHASCFGRLHFSL